MHYQFITAIRSLILEKIQNREHYAVNARKKKEKLGPSSVGAPGG
jgi:hypothetical protein